jgi:hypothetical protein
MGLFAPLPGGFPQLVDAAAGSSTGPMEPRPADLLSLAQRLRQAYAQARSRHYDDLSPGQWRQLPYAYWDGGQEPLPEVEPRLVRRYWREVLRPALTSRPTMASRWLAPLFHTYIGSFRSGDRAFARYAQEFSTQVGMAVGPLASTLRTAHERVGLLQPDRLGPRLAAALLAHRGSIDGWLVELCLAPDFPASPLGRQVLQALLQSPEPTLRLEPAIDKVLAWSAQTGEAPARSSLRVPFANGLLLPWVDHRQHAAATIRDKLMATFVPPESYGDPRWVGRAGYQWQGVHDEAVSVVKRWLAGKSLETFVNALKLTADETWEYREKFWLAYHRRGYVDDVWLVLGSEAKERIGYSNLGAGMQCGSLLNDSPGRRSVLLLQLGDLTFVEWSHSGALRAYKTADPKAPKLYRNEYDREELTDDRSMWMHDATADNKNPHLYHHGSDGGTWQKKARDFINSHTGVYLPDREIA